MLDKKDLYAIGEVIEKKIAKSLSDFFSDVIAPYFDEHVEKKLEEHDRRFDQMEVRFDHIDRKLEKIDDRLDKHDIRLEKYPSFT